MIRENNNNGDLKAQPTETKMVESQVTTPPIDLDTILLGDSFEICERISDKTIDLILEDMPYKMTHCNWDKEIDLQLYWESRKRIIKDNGVIILTAQQPFASDLITSNRDMFRYEWIWEKTQATGHLNAKKMPMKAHENVLIFYKKPPTYNPLKTIGHERKVATAVHKRNTNTGDIYGKCDNFNDYDSTERYPRTVQTFASDKQKNNLHPTQKPLALMEYLIKTYSNENDLVLDGFGGSGTTAIAAYRNNRRFIVVEKEKEFYETANERLCNERLAQTG